MFRNVTLRLLLLLVPAAASAQNVGIPTETPATGLFLSQVRTPPRAPGPMAAPSRRRGSMVGYIDDSLVHTRVRVRFESGWHNRVPDRTEFFYAKCGCYSLLDKNDPAFDSEAPGPLPGVVTDMNFQQAFIEGEYTGGGRWSVFGEVPLRWIEPKAFAPGTGSFENQSGLGDIRGGLKIGLADGSTYGATLQVKGFLASGKAENGLGTNHQSVEPSVLLYNSVNDRVAIESQAGFWQPFGGSKARPDADGEKFTGPVFFWGVGPSVEAYRRNDLAVSPVVELMHWRVIKGSQTTSPGDAAGTNIVNLKFGARVSWAENNSFYIGWGHALTDATWYENILRFEFRRAF